MKNRKLLRIIKLISKEINKKKSIKEISENLLKIFMKYTHAKTGAILIYENSNNKLKILSKKGILSKITILNSLKKKDFFNRRKDLAIPIIHNKKILGAIYLGGKKFNKREIKYAMTGKILIKLKFQKEVEADKIKQIFKKYVGKETMDEILKNPNKDELSGSIKKCTILFADINNFTEYSNSKKPKEVVSFLNNYFSKMSKIAFKNNGVVDKFIGDAIMVVFGSLISQKNNEEKAIKTAKEMVIKMRQINKEYKNVKMGLSVGIATGKVVAGNIGCKKMMDYTVIGKKVNLASRLTSFAGKNQIFVDETTKKSAKNFKYKEFGKTDLKGFKKMSVFKVL